MLIQTMAHVNMTILTYSLTVSVDMSVEGFTGDNMIVRLNGGDWLTMTDMGDNIWSYTFTDLGW